jgi:Protein of unknown function (DUF1592)/Protein of unknown function (DUF1588)/Protein of unknown function (DUF1595)/Protein of unknown function (DUF1585)
MSRHSSLTMKIVPFLLLGLIGCTGSILGGPASGSGGNGPNGTGSPGNPGNPNSLPAYVPAPLQSKRLLSFQYRNAVRDILGDKASATLKVELDPLINGQSSVAASQLSYSSSSIDTLEQNAFLAAQAALADAVQKKKLIACTPSKADDADCLTKTLEPLGRRFLRRSLSVEEKAAYLKVGTEAALAYSDFSRGVEFAIAAMMQSPHFLYIHSVGDGQPISRLSGTEVASRMSFFLVGTTPTDALLDAAEAGQLETEEQVRAAAMALLEARPVEARAALKSFWREYFDLTALPLLGKDPGLVPNFDDGLKAEFERETTSLMEHVIFDGSGDVRDVFDAPFSFLTKRLAEFYGVAGVSSTTPVKVTLDQNRRGVFSQGAWLSLQAHPADHSPTYRGKFIREKLLCETVSAPPPDVDTSLPPAPSGQNQTYRQRLTQKTAAARCQNCHTQMDPIGFAFERFDLAGRYRETESNLPLDSKGDLDGKPYDGAPAMVALLKQDERTSTCLTRSLFRFAQGHIETDGESRPIASLSETFRNKGYSIKSLMVELVVNETFRSGTKP